MSTLKRELRNSEKKRKMISLIAQLKSLQAFSDVVKSMRAEINNPQAEYNKNSTLKTN